MGNNFKFKKLIFNWQIGLFLIFLFSIPRFIIVLEANRTGNYSLTSLVFVVMAITPFILLSKQGRKMIGLIPIKSYAWLTGSFVMGALFCTLVFLIGVGLFGYGHSNWFVYISQSYGAIPASALGGPEKWTYFLIFAAVGMTFSPIGEEFLYRGLIHQCFTKRFGENGASVIDSLAFALVHLAHFGIIFSAGGWEFLPVPALLWMALMYMAGRLFYICRKKTGSIYGAVISHAGFNLAMTWFIFYFIL
jgi:hypothetical protein